MDLKLQEDFLKMKIEEPFYSDYYKVEKFDSRKYDNVYHNLLHFCGKNKESRIVILSRWCKKIPGLKLKTAFKCLPLFKLHEYVHPFRDEDYLTTSSNKREILIPLPKLAIISDFLKVSKKELKIALGSDVYFSLDHYEKYIILRKAKRAKEQANNANYFEQIELKDTMYFNKEYVSEHKYASGFLQTFVETNKQNITDGELATKNILDSLNIEYEFQKPCLVAGHSYIMDFYLPKYGLCIEIDGEYHNSQEQIHKDFVRTNILSRSGILVVRFSNEEALNKYEIGKFLRNVLKIELVDF